MSWCYDDAFRRIHVLYTSPEWARERGSHFDVDRYIEMLAAARVNCIQMYAKDHRGYCYYRATEGIPFPFDLLGAIVPKAHAAGIKVLAYYSLGWDEYALGRNPTWRAIDQRGLARRYRKLYAWCCPNTPYRDFCLRQVQEISDNYDVDGFWIDIIPVITDGVTLGWNWAPDFASEAAQYPVPCYCPDCRRKFRAQFQRDIPLHPTEEERIISYQFLLDATRSWLDEFAAVVHRSHPDAVLIYNGAGAMEDAINTADANCAEGTAPAHSYQSYSCRWTRSHGKPYEIIVSSGLPDSVQSTWKVPQPVWYDHWTQKPAEVLQLEASIAAAHGGNATITSMPYANGVTEEGQFVGFRAAFEHIEQMETYVKGAEKVNDVALALTVDAYRAPHRWADTVEGARHFHEALLQGHFQYDVVEAWRVADYGQFQVVVLPNQLTLSQAEADRLRRYVFEGGNLILTGHTSLYDEHGRLQADFALADVMGVHFDGHIEDHFAYVRLRDARLTRGIPDVPILINRSPLVLQVQDSEVLAWVARPEALRSEATTMIWGNPMPDDSQLYPFVVMNTYGHGRCCTVAAPLDTLGSVGTWTRRMAMNLVDALLNQKCLTTDAPPGVEVVWNRQPGRSIVHLLNYHIGDPDRLSTEQSRLVVHGVNLRLAQSRVGTFGSVRMIGAGGSHVSYTTREGWLEIEVPPFSVHAALLIE
jgi:hypothetical protein